MNVFLKDGSPDLKQLIDTFGRCQPNMPGGLEWLNRIRECKWPGQFLDGRKHDIDGDPKGAAMPWNNASDCRPFVVDSIINEIAGTLTEAFWRAMALPGSASSEEGAYAVALTDHLIWNSLYDSLVKEVELSAQYIAHYGWCVLSPRWKQEIGLKRYTLKLGMIQEQAQQAAQRLVRIQANPQELQQMPAEFMEQLQEAAQLPVLIMDPTLEEPAVEALKAFYDRYVQSTLPEDLRNRAPRTKNVTAKRVLKELREQGQATVPLPYLCKDEPEVCALKPWEEVFLPPENVDANDCIFIAEWVTDTELDSRVLSEEYDADWVTEVKKFKGQMAVSMQMPVGTSGNALAQMGDTTSTASQYSILPGGQETGLMQIVHAVYRAVDEDGIPGSYMTTFHPAVNKDKHGKSLLGKHGLADSERAQLPYVTAVNEWRSRSVTSSRGVAELAHTDQNLIKGSLDALIDRTSITLLPPVNVYESPMGAKYEFGPARQNFVKPGREPQFMELPSGQGLVDGVKVHDMVSKRIDNRFGLLSEDVPTVRIQTSQAHRVRRFLLAWTSSLQHSLNDSQVHMADKDFSKITGAPEGWLDEHRADPGILVCGLQFDVRELDSELTMKRVEAVNKVVIPADVMGTVNRAKWTRVMMRCINPSWAREVMMPVNDASQALFDKAKLEVLNMFAGTQPNFLDKNDPTAGSLLEYTQQIVTANPNYLRSLSDDALTAIAGQSAPMLAQQIGQRTPNERFSALLIKWLENLKFIGVTQVKNKEIGRIGVDAEETP